MNIVVNTRFLLKDKLEGIGWFTYETLKKITRKYPEVEFVFLFDRPYHKDFILSTDNYLSLRTKVPTTLVTHDLAFEHYPEHIEKLPLKYLKHFSPRFA